MVSREPCSKLQPSVAGQGPGDGHAVGAKDEGGGRRMRVVIIGANGQLGSDLVRVLSNSEFVIRNCEVVPLAHADMEVADFESVKEVLSRDQPDYVINTAAFHNVPACEKQPEWPFSVNAIGAWNVARVCAGLGAALVHISTDYVFDGEKKSPYVEDDLPRPLNVYGVSKLSGEHLIRYTLERHFIIRTSGLYGMYPCRAKGGENFVELMLRLAREREELRVVNDEVLTPTYTLDLARQIALLMQTRHYGLYHASSGGQCSWHEFARAVFDLTGTAVNLQPTTADEFPRPVRRPAYSVLENRALKELGLDRMRPWQDALGAYLEEREN